MVITPNSDCLVADPIVASLWQVDIIPVHTWNMPSFASLTIPELPPRLKRYVYVSAVHSQLLLTYFHSKRDSMHLRNASAAIGDTPDVPATASATAAGQPPSRQRTTQPAAALPASGLSILTKTRLHRQEIRSGTSSQRGNTAIRSTRRSARRAKAAEQSTDTSIIRTQDKQPSTSPSASSICTASAHDHLSVVQDSTGGGADVVVAPPGGGGEAAGAAPQTDNKESHSTTALHQPVSVDDESVDELEGHAETGDGRMRGRSEELVEEALAQGGGAL